MAVALPGRGGAGSAPGVQFARAGGSYGTSICASGGDGEEDGGELLEAAAPYFAAVCLPLGRAAVTRRLADEILSIFTCPATPPL